MCLSFFSVYNHPKYKLIIAANRDEFYKRKTAAAAFWEDHPNLLGGRDLEAGGTWMGITKEGRIGMVTNYRDLKNINPNAPSRGHLVSDYLTGDMNAVEYLKEIQGKAGDYNGFNLVLGNADELVYFSNYQNKIITLTKGTHGLSNALLDTPWPKVVRGKEKLNVLINKNEIDKNELFELLYNSETAPDDKLPDTGLDLERERALSAMFIQSPGYGTRCSTVIQIDYENRITFTERVFDLTTFDYSEKSFLL